MRPLVSVICPVYNAEDYLLQTLECITKQTYEELEILMVDDGSNDNSLEICLKEAEKDGRIKVIHTENNGVACARNLGLSKVSGEYVTFIDSDDIVSSNFIEVMIKAALRTNEEIVTCRYYNEEKHDYQSFKEIKRREEPVVEVIDFNRYRYTNQYAHTVVWGGVYRSSLIRDMKFATDLFVGEDTYFFAEALNKVKSLAFVDEILYFYRYRTDSLAHKKYNKKQASEITSWERVCQLFENETDEFLNECKTQLGWTCIKNYERAIKSNYDDAKAVKEMYQKARYYSKFVLKSKEISKIKKIYYCMFSLFPNLTIKLKNFAKQVR